MTIDRILSLIAIIVSFIAVPASGYLSYRYAVIGEKRKEFNVVSDVIRQKLREHERHLEQGIYPYGQYIEVSQFDFDLLVDVSDRRVRDCVRKLINDYQIALSSGFHLTEHGDHKLIDATSAISALHKLMPYISRK